jgi:hypothetical protein
MLAIKSELENIPLSDTQRDMLLAMDNVLEQAWTFRNTPVPDRCMDPENISEVVYYFLQDNTVQRREKELRSCQFHVNGEPPQELKDYYELYGEELNNPDLEPAGEVER